MKNLMKKAQQKMITLDAAVRQAVERTKAAVTDRSGQGALDTAVTVLISIVLGALILGGLYLVINGTVLPTITQRIREMFDYAG